MSGTPPHRRRCRRPDPTGWQQEVQAQPGRGACSTTAVMGDALFLSLTVSAPTPAPLSPRILASLPGSPSPSSSPTRAQPLRCRPMSPTLLRWRTTSSMRLRLASDDPEPAGTQATATIPLPAPLHPPVRIPCAPSGAAATSSKRSCARPAPSWPASQRSTPMSTPACRRVSASGRSRNASGTCASRS